MWSRLVFQRPPRSSASQCWPLPRFRASRGAAPSASGPGRGAGRRPGRPGRTDRRRTGRTRGPSAARALGRPAACPSSRAQARRRLVRRGEAEEVGPGVEVEVGRRRRDAIPGRRSARALQVIGPASPAARSCSARAATRPVRPDGGEVGAAVLVEVGHEQAGDAAVALAASPSMVDRVEAAQAVVEDRDGAAGRRRRGRGRGRGRCRGRGRRSPCAAPGPERGPRRRARGVKAIERPAVAGRSVGATASGAQLSCGRPGTGGGLAVVAKGGVANARRRLRVAEAGLRLLGSA